MPLLLGILLWFSVCHTVPHTGRSALHLVPTKRLTSMAYSSLNDSNERRYPEMLIITRCASVGERIAYVAAPDMPNAQWEFVVFDDPGRVNAFAMPGGKVAVYTGIFKVAKTENDLAVVVGHEIAHISQDMVMSVSAALLAAGGAMALQVGMEDIDSFDQQMLMAAYGASTTIGLILPHSRKNESEADEIGLIYVQGWLRST